MMRKPIYTCLILGVLFVLFPMLSLANNDWENPLVIEKNKLQTYAMAMQYASEEQAIADNVEESDWVMSLNGMWDFHWEKSALTQVGDFYSPDYKTRKWTKMPVPGNWEIHGFGVPYYTNIFYPFPVNPPYVPNEDNPVGRYRKEFEVPDFFKDKRVILHLGAVSSAAYVWMNGEKVGYTQGSKIAAEFDITSYIKEGKNLLALEVYRWSDGSYLEDQDFWRLSGIERDVLLIARDEVHIQDFEVEQDLTDNYRDGKFGVQFYVRNSSKDYQEAKIDVKLLDSDLNPVYQSGGSVRIHPQSYEKLRFKSEIPNIKKWNAETPNLYTLLIEKTVNGISTYTSQQIGFRKIEIINRRLCINGAPIWVTGVNRHDHNEKNGHVISKADYEKDIQMMKRFNMNTVRTAHYPNDPYFLRLCNQYGIYLINEANVESHGMGNTADNILSNSSDWLNAHFSRISRMVERDKNQPSVIVWSMGNEAGYGTNFSYCGEWLRKRDPSRKTLYPAAKMRTSVDISGFGYPTKIIDTRNPYRQVPVRGGQDMPILHHEYIHTMGNSGGNLSWYEDMMEEYPNFIGGCTWDWMDQGILTRDKDGNEFWAYGGDFGPEPYPTVRNFCCNGIMRADMTPNPSAFELKHFFQKVKFKHFDTNEQSVVIENKFDFINLRDVCYLTWELLKDGHPIAQDTIKGLTLAAGGSVRIDLDMPAYDNQAEYIIAFKAFATDKLAYMPQGEEIAREEFQLTTVTPQAPIVVSKGKLSTQDDKTVFHILGDDFVYSWDKTTGYLTYIEKSGYNYLTGSLRPNFWRVPTDNDFGWRSPEKLAVWFEDSQKQTLLDFQAEKQDSSLFVIATHLLPVTKAQVKMMYEVCQSGVIHVEMSLENVNDTLPCLPRVGVRMGVNKALQDLSYYGKGDVENYIDRNRFSLTRVYRSTVEEQTYWYVRPQENGNKTNVRWLSLKNKDEKMSIYANQAWLSMNVSNYPIEEYSNKFDIKVKKETSYKRVNVIDVNTKETPITHPYQIRPSEHVELLIDACQMGVGGDDSWGAMPHDEYMVHPQEYKFEFSILVNHLLQ